jgi:hypothetical protein
MCSGVCVCVYIYMYVSVCNQVTDVYVYVGRGELERNPKGR